MYKYVVAFSLFLLGAQTTEAALRRCDGCTENGYQAMAINAGPGVQHVYDFYNGEARRYRVEREPNELGKYDYFVDSEPVEPEFESVVLEYSTYYHETNFTMQSIFELGATDGISDMTAFDAAVPGPGQTRIKEWLLSPAANSYRNALPQLGLGIHSAILAVVNLVKANPLVSHVVIVFKNGSRIELTLDAVNETVEIVEKSATDELGNTIPATAENANGMRFDFSRDSTGLARQRMEQFLTLRGVKVVGSIRYECITVDKVTTCHPY